MSWNDSDYPYNYQEDYHLENVNISYTNAEGKWTLSAYVNNIFEYAEKRMYMAGPMAGSIWIGNPRTYGAVLSIRY
jgi:hypothetical protein